MLIHTLTLQTTTLLKYNRLTLIKIILFGYVVVKLFMSDVDGYAETIVSLAYASKTIQR